MTVKLDLTSLISNCLLVLNICASRKSSPVCFSPLFKELDRKKTSEWSALWSLRDGNHCQPSSEVCLRLCFSVLFLLFSSGWWLFCKVMLRSISSLHSFSVFFFLSKSSVVPQGPSRLRDWWWWWWWVDDALSWPNTECWSIHLLLSFSVKTPQDSEMIAKHRRAVEENGGRMTLESCPLLPQTGAALQDMLQVVSYRRVYVPHQVAGGFVCAECCILLGLHVENFQSFFSRVGGWTGWGSSLQQVMLWSIGSLHSFSVSFFLSKVPSRTHEWMIDESLYVCLTKFCTK